MPTYQLAPLAGKPLPAKVQTHVDNAVAYLTGLGFERVVVIDFESPYGKGFSLTGMTYPEYIKDDRFVPFGASISINGGIPTYYSTDDLEVQISGMAANAAQWARTVIVGQNLKFDASVLAWHYMTYAGGYIDLMDLANMLWPGDKANLKAITMRLFPDEPGMWKTDELANFANKYELDKDEHTVMAVYCNQDTRVTLGSVGIILDQYNIPLSELMLMELTLRMFIQPLFYLNQLRVQAYHDQVVSEKKHTIDRAKKVHGITKTTLGSNKQFCEWLEGHGCSVPYKQSIVAKTGEPKVDADGEPVMAPILGVGDARFLALMAEHPELDEVWKARVAVKSTINETRALRFIQFAQLLDGYLPAPLKYFGAHSGRWSGTQKLNMQNLPRGGELRKSLQAPAGCYVYVADSSNIEARVLAWLANETHVLTMLANKEDLYNDMATKIYGYEVDRKLLDEDENKVFGEEGNVGKTARLGLGYSMGPPKFQQALAAGPMGAGPIYKSFEFCKLAVDTFRADNPQTVRLWAFMDAMLPLMADPDCYVVKGPLVFRHERIELPNGTSLKYPGLKCVEDEWPDGRPKMSWRCERGGKVVNLYGGILTENVVQALARIVVSDQITMVLNHFNNVDYIPGLEIFPDDHSVDLDWGSHLMPYNQCRLALTTHDEGAFIMSQNNADKRQKVLNHIFTLAPHWCSDIPLGSEGGYALEYSK